MLSSIPNLVESRADDCKQSLGLHRVGIPRPQANLFTLLFEELSPGGSLRRVRIHEKGKGPFFTITFGRDLLATCFPFNHLYARGL